MRFCVVLARRWWLYIILAVVGEIQGYHMAASEAVDKLFEEVAGQSRYTLSKKAVHPWASKVTPIIP